MIGEAGCFSKKMKIATASVEKCMNLARMCIENCIFAERTEDK